MNFHIGIVEDNKDPRELGRVRVRVFGIHTYDKVAIPTETLPWATVMQPTTSAANSGVGHTPRLLNGSMVVVLFTDPEDMQYPIIIGTLPSEIQDYNVKVNGSKVKPSKTVGFGDPLGVFPRKHYQSDNDLPKLARNYNTRTQTVVSATSATAAKQKTTETVQPSSKVVDAFPPSQLKTSNATIEDLKKSEAFRSKPYDDGIGVWTIGYGSTFLKDNSRVTANTPPITQQEGDALLRYKIEKDFESAVKKSVKVDVTQSMFDSLVHMAYNVGGGGLRTFANDSGLNNTKYAEAAEYMKSFRVLPGSKVERGLRKRRDYEATLFLKDGIPGGDKAAATATPEQAFEPTTTTTTSTTQTALKAEFERKTLKFKNSLFEMEEPGDIRDRHQYPFNQVKQSQAGHHEEWDDTPGNERLNKQHSRGTYEEWRPDGSVVTKIYKDNYTLIAKDDNIYIGGNVNVHINGNSNLYIQGSQKTHITGDHYVQVDGNVTELVAGNKTTQVKGSFAHTVAGTTNENHGAWYNKVSGAAAIDASGIDWNSGIATTSNPAISPLQSVGVIPMAEPDLSVLNDKQRDAIEDSAEKSKSDPEPLKGVGEVPDSDVQPVKNVEPTDDKYITLSRNLDTALSQAKSGGWKETGSNANIIASYKAVGQNLSTDTTPWCAAFAGAVLKSSGIESLRTLSSLAYKGFGTSVPVSDPTQWRLNDIIVFSRAGGGHIGFFRGFNKANNSVLVLGGNQSDNLTEVGFKITDKFPVVYVGRKWDLPSSYDKPVTYSGTGPSIKVV